MRALNEIGSRGGDEQLDQSCRDARIVLPRGGTFGVYFVCSHTRTARAAIHAMPCTHLAFVRHLTRETHTTACRPMVARNVHGNLRDKSCVFIGCILTYDGVLGPMILQNKIARNSAGSTAGPRRAIETVANTTRLEASVCLRRGFTDIVIGARNNCQNGLSPGFQLICQLCSTMLASPKNICIILLNLS
jgi:hypothetical protein